MMKKYSVRPARSSDLETVYRIISRQNGYDYGGSTRTLDDLSKAWQQMNLEQDTCAAFADGKLSGYAELLDNDSPFIYLAERTNVDLAFELLTILEEKAIARKKGPATLVTRISAKNNTLLQLFASKGYKSKLSFLIMTAELKAPPSKPEWPARINVRNFVPNQDEQATYQTDEEAARDKGYHTPLTYESWKKRMGTERDSFDPSLWFLATDGAEVVGVALNVYLRKENTGLVDHLGVLGSWRRKGIGKALLLHTFNEFYERGINHIKLSIDSRSLTEAPHLYQSVGMRASQEYYIYRKEI